MLEVKAYINVFHRTYIMMSTMYHTKQDRKKKKHGHMGEGEGGSAASGGNSLRRRGKDTTWQHICNFSSQKYLNSVTQQARHTQVNESALFTVNCLEKKCMEEKKGKWVNKSPPRPSQWRCMWPCRSQLNEVFCFLLFKPRQRKTNI